MLRHLDIQNLQPGMVIVRIIKQNGPIKIKKSGLVTSQDMVQGLIEMGIQQVEVDPDQTVEVEAPQIKKSATRRMLESNKVTHTQVDDGLSDQFHRSLFLPSVQGIPSAWQFYAKRYLFVAFIAFGGLGFGWTLANYQVAVTLLSSLLDRPVVSVPAPVATPVAAATGQLENKIESSIQVNKRQETHSVLIANAAVQDDMAQNFGLNLGQSLGQELEQTEDVPAITPEAEPEPEPQISADVLARFRKAINEVEDLPVTAAPVESLASSEDVPRVDQLPAWVMNRLPSMAFSAHMYASLDSERWVRVNGSRMVEGDKIDGMIEIVRIEPQHVILNYSGQTFSMAALTDW
jgi:general secretion pathway protein B